MAGLDYRGGAIAKQTTFNFVYIQNILRSFNSVTFYFRDSAAELVVINFTSVVPRVSQNYVSRLGCKKSSYKRKCLNDLNRSLIFCFLLFSFYVFDCVHVFHFFLRCRVFRSTLVYQIRLYGLGFAFSNETQ